MQDAENYKEKIQARRQLALFAWQAPMMCLCYSIILFLAGLTAVVISPFASIGTWGDEAKVGFCISVISCFLPNERYADMAGLDHDAFSGRSDKCSVHLVRDIGDCEWIPQV